MNIKVHQIESGHQSRSLGKIRDDLSSTEDNFLGKLAQLGPDVLINLKELTEEFMSQGPLVSDLVIGRNPREKQLKNEARMFATMPVRVRLVVGH